MSQDNYSGDVKRERDTIRMQMENVVGQMQKIEAELDAAGGPGSAAAAGHTTNAATTEAKRRELSALRQELAELRGRMRRAMEAAQRQAQSMQGGGGTSVGSANISDTFGEQQQQQNRSPPSSHQRALPMTNFSSQQQPQPQLPVSSALSPGRGASPPGNSGMMTTSQQGQHRFNSPAGSSPSSMQHQVGRVTGTFEEARAGLLRRHQAEKMQLQELFVSMQRQMDARHEGELGQLGDRLREEEARLRELESARARWEEAHRAREMCFKMDSTAPPEISMLRQQQQLPAPQQQQHQLQQQRY